MCCKVIFDFIPKIEKSLWNRYALCPSYLNCSFEKKSCYRRGKVSTTSRWLHSWACWSCETAGYEPCIRSAIWEKTEPVKASTTDGAMNGGQVSCTHKHRRPHTLTDKQMICLRSQSMHRASMHVRTYFFKQFWLHFVLYIHVVWVPFTNHIHTGEECMWRGTGFTKMMPKNYDLPSY